MTVAFISHPDCLLHEMGDFHPEQPARIQAIHDALVKSELMNVLKPYSAPLATRAQLIRVHDEKYVNTIFANAPKTGSIALDPDTSMNPHTLQAALRAAGAAILAVDLVMTTKVTSAFCNVRPPGHHAEKDKAMGFCFFNNIAVGVAHALEHYALKRVAIVDFDVHHGNGTEDIFQNDERVLFCSSFQSPFYPYCGVDTNSKHIINIPLPTGTTGEIFREKVKEYWLEKINLFQPEIIFFSAGFDAYIQDELADLQLVEEDYAWVTEQIKEIAVSFCQGRMISMLEGGYHLEGLGRCAVAHVRALT